MGIHRAFKLESWRQTSQKDEKEEKERLVQLMPDLFDCIFAIVLYPQQKILNSRKRGF
jgi:hypothetical protein